MSKNLSAVQQDHVDYLITIGKGGNNGVTSLLKTPEDHAQWEANMRWFAYALLEARPAHEHVSNDCVECLRIERYAALASPLLPQQGGEQTNSHQDSGKSNEQACLSVSDDELLACMGDDAAKLASENADCEIAETLRIAAARIEHYALQIQYLQSSAAVLPQVGEAKAVAKYPRNKVAMKCWGCSQQVAPGEGVTPTAFNTECYHEECRRLAALTSHPGVPMTVPDDHFKVGNLLRKCACGSRSPEMKVSDIDPVKGALFWIECCECGAKSSRKPFRAHAGIAWNSLAAPVAQALPVAAEKSLTYEQRHAIKEGERNAASSEYFRARTPLMNTSANLSIFDAGFDRGFDAGVQGEKA